MVQSTLAAESLAQVEAVETWHWLLLNILSEVLRGKPIRTDSMKGMECRTDTCSLYEAIHANDSCPRQET